MTVDQFDPWVNFGSEPCEHCRAAPRMPHNDICILRESVTKSVTKVVANVERTKRHLAEDRRVHLVHAKARLREIEDVVTAAIRRVDDGRLDELNLVQIERALLALRRIVTDDEYAAFMQRELA